MASLGALLHRLPLPHALLPSRDQQLGGCFCGGIDGVDFVAIRVRDVLGDVQHEGGGAPACKVGLTQRHRRGPGLGISVWVVLLGWSGGRHEGIWSAGGQGAECVRGTP
jgi:hypothetical protein